MGLFRLLWLLYRWYWPFLDEILDMLFIVFSFNCIVQQLFTCPNLSHSQIGRPRTNIDAPRFPSRQQAPVRLQRRRVRRGPVDCPGPCLQGYPREVDHRFTLGSAAQPQPGPGQQFRAGERLRRAGETQTFSLETLGRQSGQLGHLRDPTAEWFALHPTILLRLLQLLQLLQQQRLRLWLLLNHLMEHSSMFNQWIYLVWVYLLYLLITTFDSICFQH